MRACIKDCAHWQPELLYRYILTSSYIYIYVYCGPHRSENSPGAATDATKEAMGHPEQLRNADIWKKPTNCPKPGLRVIRCFCRVALWLGTNESIREQRAVEVPAPSTRLTLQEGESYTIHHTILRAGVGDVDYETHNNWEGGVQSQKSPCWRREGEGKRRKY